MSLSEAQRAETYAWWQGCLAAVQAGHDPIPLPETVGEDPTHGARPGYFRTRKGEPLEIRIDGDGDLHGRVGDGRWHCSIDDDWMKFVEWHFSSACRHPVSQEAFNAAMAGQPWPDVDAFVHANPTPGIGHNSGPMGVEAFTDQATSACAGASAYAEITDDETAGRAQSLRSRLGELLKEGRKHRDVEEAPLKAAYDAVHEAWMAPLRQIETTGKEIRESLTRWENAKAQAEREAKKAAAAAAPEAAKVIEAATAPVKRQVKGGYGRAAAVKTILVASIKDQDAAYTALRDDKDVIAAIFKAADKIIRAGGKVPGVEAIEERRVR